jgi:predicted Zn-dependent protease
MQRFPGFYSDGATAEQRAVEAVLEPHGLAIRDAAHREIARWSYATIELVEEVYAGQPIRLRNGRRDAARLVLRDPAALDALRRMAPRLGGSDLRGARPLVRVATWLTATIAVLVGLFYGLPYMARPVAALIPVSWEESVGEKVIRQVKLLFGGRAGLKTCTDPDGVAALDRLTRRLARQVDSPYTFRVQVMDSAVVNALAAPGGYIVFFKGLIEKADSAEEVAGVLGHEMGHVIHRHGMQGLVRQQSLKLLLGAVADSTLADIGSILVTLKYGRDAEAEADATGVAILNKADIRAAGLAGFFRRLAGKDPQEPGFDRYIGSHPPSIERARDIESRAQGKGDAMSAADWQALKRICARTE